MIPAAQPLIADLEERLSSRSEAQNSAILQRVSELFFNGYATFNDDHISVFDDVLSLMIERAPTETLAELSARLAPLAKAPMHVLSLLAQHEEIAVAGPILEQSNLLSDDTLAEIAGITSERHRAVIAGRPQLSETVTDGLVQHSYAEVACKLAANLGARFSPMGFVKLINQAKADKELAAAIASRTDVPDELQPFLKLALES
jgi:uncharacterized protein (DUF2336 family)